MIRWPFGKRAAVEQRAMDPSWSRLAAGFDGLAPAAVSPAQVEGLATAAACINLICETSASLPLKVFARRPDGSREETGDHPVAALLARPNDFQNGLEFREWFVREMLLHGNGFSRLVMDERGQVVRLDPLPAETVTPLRLASGRVGYDVTEANGRGRARLLADEIMHAKWRPRGDGLVGQSPICAAAGVFATAHAEQAFQASLMANAAQPAGALKVGGVLSDEALKTLRDNWERRHGGPGNAGRVAILEAGMDWVQLGLSAEDAQLIASRRLSNEDIARVFGVPPPVVGILDNATYSNISEQLKSFVRLCIRPWLVRLEQCFNYSLFSEIGRRQYFCEHQVEGLLRADTKDRFEAYAVARQWGWLSADDIRRLENLPAIPGGDVYLSPLNMMPTAGGTEAGSNG